MAALTKKRTRQRDGDATRAAILAAAEELFASVGVRGATFEAIAERANVGKSMIPYHFTDKQRLYEAVLDAAVSDVVGRARAEFSQHEAPAEQLRSFIRSFGEAIAARPTLPAMIMREMFAGEEMQRPGALAKLSEFLKTTTEIYTRGKKRGEFRALDPHMLHLIIVGALIHFVATDSFRRKVTAGPTGGFGTTPSVDDFIRLTQDLLTEGIAAKKRGR